MGTALLKTKLYIPPLRAGLVSRPRLVRRLDEGVRQGQKITLISAPAGFGKTTLLSEWAADTERPVAWLSLDKGDNDPTRFWSHVIAALQTVDRDLGEAFLVALQSRQSPSLEPLLTGLINEIAERSLAFVLVLDDYHVVTATRIDDALLFLLENSPPQMHLILSSRADPPWPLARLRARRAMAEIRTQDLRFTPDEASAFLSEVMGLKLSPENVAALDTRTEGWIAGLQMAALSMRGRDASAFVRAFSGSHRFILDYLLEEVLDRQPDDVQDFLLKTSILERMSASLCDAVTDRDDSQALLYQLEQANLFLIPMDDERKWYRYHRLFADLLRSRMKQAQSDLVPALHRKASDWFQQHGAASAAIAHALAANDVERAMDLIESNSERMIFRSEHATVSRWLDSLPEDLIKRRPWLCVLRAWTRYWIGPREEAEGWLRCAERALQSMGATPDAEDGAGMESPTGAKKRRIVGNIAAVRAYLALQNHEFSHVLEMAQRAARLLPEEDASAGVVFLALGGMYWGEGDTAAAERAFDKARDVGLKSGHRSLAVTAICYAGIQQAKRGYLRQALETYRDGLERAIGPDGRELPSAGYPSLKIGDVLREWNDLESASNYIVRGLERCIEWGPADVVAEGYIALARLRLVEGNLEEVTSVLEKAEQLARTAILDPWNNCWLDDCRVRLWLAQGDLAAAIHWTQTNGLAVDGELSYHYDLHHINLARLLVARGTRRPAGPHLGEALQLLARLLEAAEAVGWVQEMIKVLILQSLAFQARGDNGRALEPLARALALAQPGGYVRTFVDEGPAMAKLLRQAIMRGHSVAYAGTLLAAFDDAELGAISPFEPLTDREMEVLRLLVTGLSSPELADQLYISVNTVRSHIKRIYRKLDVHSRMEAVQRAEELGMI